MENTTLITLTHSRDLLAYVPHRLGFTPQRSLVLIGMRRAQSATRLGLMVRCDLPRAWLDAPDTTMARRMVENLLADRSVNAVAVVLYLDVPKDIDLPQDADAADFGSAGPEPSAASAIRRAVVSIGLELVDELWVAGDRWRSYACGDVECCPGSGWPTTEIESSTVGAELVLAGSSPADSVDSLTALPVIDAASRDGVRRALGLAADRHATDVDNGRLLTWRRRQLDTWRRAFRAKAAPVGPERTGRLIVALSDARLRDAVMVDVLGLTKASGMLLGPQEPADDDAGLRRVAGLGDREPDPDRLATASRLLRHLAAASDGAWQAAPLTLLAWIEWCRGQSSTAGRYLDRALSADPEHRLARLMTGFVDNGLLPTWVTRPR
ncbi:DUF4192 domain-containing protein [Spelaeicoccus albus]|uniref:DUF4192 family protein n=1 Tax=Spelaeicoccus albus TaxID=1280376 RepID=A0A7Z0II54_9MICO|nr:DUF4192 domain-containing protein [Spelaeicoccus albus]NYI68149.1 hypothetical protein [Spelaeicoccus albus]